MTTPNNAPTVPSPQDYDELAITALVKQINDEYGMLRGSERRNLPKAITIGEKLIDLRPRVSKHGEWRDWLKKHCPTLAYETATGYIRLAEKQDELAAAAKVKSVARVWTTPNSEQLFRISQHLPFTLSILSIPSTKEKNIIYLN